MAVNAIYPTQSTTNTSASSNAQSTSAQSAPANSTSEDDLLSVDIESADLETLQNLLKSTQESTMETVQNEYTNLIAQIQIKINNLKHQKQILMMQMANYVPKEGEKSKASDFMNRLTTLNKQEKELNQALSETMSDYSSAMNKIIAQAQNSVNISSSSQGTVIASQSTGAQTAGGSTITTNLDGSTTEIDSIIQKYANEAGLDPNFVKAVVKAESSFNPSATSSCGAMGLMQLMPSTAASLGCSDPYDPEQNIKAGVKYLKQMYDQFGSYELALAAYNAGPGAVEKNGGIPPYAETQAYVPKIMGYWENYKLA